MKVLKGMNRKAWIAALYGVPGCGKSTLATYAPNPLFLDIENGLERIDSIKYQEDDWKKDRTQIKTWDELTTALREAYNADFQTIVIDTLGAVEEIITAKILWGVNKNREPKHYCSTLDDKDTFPYGSGHTLLKANWALFMEMLFKIKEGGRNVLCIGHEAIEKVTNPSGDNYDRYTLNVHKKSIVYIVSKMDAVFFAQYEKGFASKTGSDQKIAVGTGRRIIQTVEQPHCIAKNRFNLDTVIPFNTDDERKAFFEVIK